MKAMRNPETGMVYRGDVNRVHISDGFRADVGKDAARFITDTIRADAVQDELETYADAQDKALCPGCYMTVLYNAARELALANGQSVTELGRTLSAEFAKLAQGDTGPIEEVYVQLDPEPEQPSPVDEPGYLSDFGPNPLAPERDYGMLGYAYAGALL